MPLLGCGERRGPPAQKIGIESFGHLSMRSWQPEDRTLKFATPGVKDKPMQLTNDGIHHFALGEFTVTALNDGMFEASTGIVDGLPADAVEAQLTANFRPLPPRITVSAFLLRSPDRTVLIDTGCGGNMGPAMGGVLRRLDRLGVAPEAVDTVLVTHAHIDHISGLLTETGAARFANAELVLHEAEPAFWLNETIAAAAPEASQKSFALARSCLTPYAARTRTVTDGASVLPGISALHLPGHTPGHCGWVIASGNEKLLVWGDVVHLPGLQFAQPAAGLVFDVDVELARKTRRRAFDMAATDRLRVAGMHLDFPTFGHVISAGDGFSFVPEVWTPTCG